MRTHFEFYLLTAISFAIVTLGLVEWKNQIGRRNANFSKASKNSELPIQQSFFVQVIGNNFQWDFRYPGRDGVFNTKDDTYSERKLFLPPHKNVTFHITSDDYVYILGIPLNENGSNNVEKPIIPEKRRQIAVPEMTHFIEYQFTQTGEYDLMVDPLCGFQSLHDPKMGEIVVTKDKSFIDLFPQVVPGNGESPLPSESIK